MYQGRFGSLCSHLFLQCLTVDGIVPSPSLLGAGWEDWRARSSSAGSQTTAKSSSTIRVWIVRKAVTKAGCCFSLHPAAPRGYSQTGPVQSRAQLDHWGWGRRGQCLKAELFSKLRPSGTSSNNNFLILALQPQTFHSRIHKGSLSIIFAATIVNSEISPRLESLHINVSCFFPQSYGSIRKC